VTRHHGEPSHADLVACTAAAAPRRSGVLGTVPEQPLAKTKKRVTVPAEPRDTARARQRTGCPEGTTAAGRRGP